MVVWSESFRSKGSAAFSYSLKAVGIGILYLSLWAASQYFHLVPSSVAFVAMILVTASTITLALTQDAEILAVYAMIGGFSTPALVSTGQNHEISFVLIRAAARSGNPGDGEFQAVAADCVGRHAGNRGDVYRLGEPNTMTRLSAR